MRSIRSARRFEDLRTSYWFVPVLMVIGAIALSFATIALDEVAQFEWANRVGFFWRGGAEAARGLLSTVAGSMITVAGLVFSITIVALSLASQQFGPRLLRNFMRDTTNQVTLGTFIATFLYALLVLRTVDSGETTEFVPYVSVATTLVLTLVSLMVLIFFFHHVALSIQAPMVVAGVAHDLFAAIDDFFPAEVGLGAEGWEHADPEQDVPDKMAQEARAVLAQTSGYLQAIDNEALMRTAVDHDLILRFLYRPGKFVVEGKPIMLAWPAERVSDGVLAGLGRMYVTGRLRTRSQDVEFALDQLVEMALRALSPAINDPFTAMTCIDWMGAGLVRLADRTIPSRYRYDTSGRLRLFIDHAVTFAGIVDEAVNQIRQNAGPSVAVRIRLLEMLAFVADHTSVEEHRTVLIRQATLVRQGAGRVVPDSSDRADVEERYIDALTKD